MNLKFKQWIFNWQGSYYLNFIAEYKILHSSFRFRTIGKRSYTRLLFFKLNSFIWPCSPYIFNSLHQITLAESYFKLDLENFQHDFWIFVHTSVIVDQDHLSGGGSCPNLYCKELSNQKPTANTVRNTRRTTLCWVRVSIPLQIRDSPSPLFPYLCARFHKSVSVVF